MFLEVLKRRNYEFIKAVKNLHQEGVLEANTYVIDGDTVAENAKIINTRAKEFGLTVFPMTKQQGYNPILHKIIASEGDSSFVAVDWMGARNLYHQGCKLGHVGHLVQIPKSLAGEILKMKPELVTIFSVEKARELNEAAEKFGFCQKIILRVYGEKHVFYPGHEGGFHIEDLVLAAREISELKNLEIVGTTCFPCLLFDEGQKDVLHTDGFHTAVRAAKILKSELDLNITVVNVPGTTSSDLFEKISKNGGTHVEPGHGYTGTTPLATVKDIAERPAMLYLTEISHIHQGRGHIFGGGLYIDKVRGDYEVKALVGNQLLERKIELISDSGIDYYGYVDELTSTQASTTGNREEMKAGDTVIMGFRPQAFVTRGQIAVLRGIKSGKPELIGYNDINGNELKRGL